MLRGPFKALGMMLGPREDHTPPEPHETYRMTPHRKKVLRWAESVIRDVNYPSVLSGDLCLDDLEEAVEQRMAFFATVPTSVLIERLLAAIPEEALHEA